MSIIITGLFTGKYQVLVTTTFYWFSRHCSQKVFKQQNSILRTIQWIRIKYANTDVKENYFSQLPNLNLFSALLPYTV